jgi:ribonuclease HII
MEQIILKPYYEEDKLEVGIDEAGRGCLFGPVCVASVIWNHEIDDSSVVIKDSKKLSEKKRKEAYQFIIENSIAYSIQFVSNKEIDKTNILDCTLKGMHLCLDDISTKIQFDSIIVDGNHFTTYYSESMDEFIPHKCIIKGDNYYKSIAAASILAKTYRDNYMVQLTDDNPELKKYDIHNNKGYGTKKHMEAIQQYGITELHRKSFSPCH